jgi:hypothetical protein
MRTVLLLTLMSTLVTAVAQDPSAAGTWNVTGEAASGTTDGGGNWNRNAITGTLIIAQNGQTLTGTWTAATRTAVALQGTIRGETFDFRTDPREVEVIINGERTVMRLRWTFRGTVDGQTLRGTMSLDREDQDSAMPQPFAADRARSSVSVLLLLHDDDIDADAWLTPPA